MQEPREIVEALEKHAQVPEGNDERFSGYGVMGLPFASGHILCMRRFPVSSLGRGYTSVWHRNPDRGWTFIQDRPPEQSCPRYFGSGIAQTLTDEIRITWTGPRDFWITIEGAYNLDWRVSLEQTLTTQLANAAGRLLPDALWRNPSLLKMIGKAGSLCLGAGRINLTGKVPNGQRFLANPKRMWKISSSTATVQREDLGEIGPHPIQENLADIWIPQSGRFFVGDVYLESFDPERHLSILSTSGKP
jgi:hypothetical protein